MPAHLRHASVRAELLPRWLELFRQTTDEHCPPEAARAFITGQPIVKSSVHSGRDSRTRW